jgi:hypothetical protein
VRVLKNTGPQVKLEVKYLKEVTPYFLKVSASVEEHRTPGQTGGQVFEGGHALLSQGQSEC